MPQACDRLTRRAICAWRLCANCPSLGKRQRHGTGPVHWFLIFCRTDVAPAYLARADGPSHENEDVVLAAYRGEGCVAGVGSVPSSLSAFCLAGNSPAA